MKTHKAQLFQRVVQSFVVLSASLTLAFGAGVHGVPNFRTVNDQVYGGGQPSKEGFRNLATMGIRTVVDLREPGHRSDSEKKLVKALGMKYVSVPMKGMRTPTSKQISHALKALTDESKGPVFVHCRRGADRTGVVLACYRIEHDQWDNGRALREARSYGMSWYQIPLQRYVMAYKGHDKPGSLASGAGHLGDSIRDRAEDALNTIKEGAESAIDRVRN
ncbi:MAG TPA: tyrosine-protein phosphatase [Bryobacteraceae bacterium]|jgi:protein tyrosine phosphatase (PTP) superfamily phosphohydrolase (DUF442 family)|nr:tyrosine-protein phosphatase [Bryobacteraceae bacterium]